MARPYPRTLTYVGERSVAEAGRARQSGVRLFVAVTPPEAVLDEMSSLVEQLREPGQSQAGVRWTGRTQWHVTLRFLGEVEDPAPVVAALEGMGSIGLAPLEARLGPAVGLLGRSVICVPVTGLDQLATAVTEATADLGRPPEDRPFYGHLTLARLPRRKRPDPAAWVGHPLAATWPVTEIEVIRSHPGSGGSRYETLSALRLT